jgi:hypothetical protein
MTFKATVGARRPGAPEFGVLVDPTTGAESPLLLVAGDVGLEVIIGCAWAIPVGLDLERTCIPHLMTRETFHVLHEGTLAGRLGAAWSLAVAWQGRTYRIEARWNGIWPVAQAVSW